MSDFIRQWRKDVRDLGTPEFDAAAALREMMARRADIQRLASEDQRMALELTAEQRAKEAHPLNLESTRESTRSTRIANDRAPARFAITDEEAARKREDDERKRIRDATAAARAQLQADVSAGNVRPEDAGDMAQRMAESQLGMARRSATVDPVEASRWTGAVMEGLEVPYDPKATSKREEIEHRKLKDATLAAGELYKRAQQRVDSIRKSAESKNKASLQQVDQSLDSLRTQFATVNTRLERLGAGLDPETGIPLESTELATARERFIQQGVAPGAIVTNPDGSTSIRADAADIVVRQYHERIRRALPGDKVLDKEMQEYAEAVFQMDVARENFRMLSEKQMRGIGLNPVALPAAAPEAAAPEKKRPADRKTPPPKKPPPPRVVVPEQDVSAEPEAVPAELKKYKDLREVRPGVYRFTIPGSGNVYEYTTSSKSTRKVI